MKKMNRTKMDTVFGINPVLELLGFPEVEILEMLIAEGKNPRIEEITAICKKRGIPVTRVSMDKLDKLTSWGNHQKVLATIAPWKYANFPDSLVKEGSKTVFLLDSLTDVGNFSSLLRSLLFLGVDMVIIPADRSVSMCGNVHRLSAGASLKIPVARVPNLCNAMERLKKEGFFIYGAAGEGSEMLAGFDFPERTAIVLGSEGKGLRPRIREVCDQLIAIEGASKLDSLNVAMAGAIFAYEIKREDKTR
jgi:23S rRNA (guanosine2251-2'-O)-methyltransferase